MPELKPCPKCGGTLVQMQSTFYRPHRWQGVCVRCGFMSPLADSLEQAKLSWNAQYIDRAIGSEKSEH